jgi:hypothetical protein
MARIFTLAAATESEGGFGKIGTVAQNAQLLVRCPTSKKTTRVKWFVKSDKAVSVQAYLVDEESIVNAATITLADATPLDDGDTLILNGVTLTAEDTLADATLLKFYSGGADEIATATALAACINLNVPGVVATAAARVVSLTCAGGATVLQFAQGTSDANEAAFASTTLTLLRPSGSSVSIAANTTTGGKEVEQWVDGLTPYLGVTNTEALAATLVIEAVRFHDS